MSRSRHFDQQREAAFSGPQAHALRSRGESMCPERAFENLPGEASGLSSPRNCGLKARAIIAWGNAPGYDHPTTRGLKASAKSLIPNKLLIKGITILYKHNPHLGLKITPLMMHHLRIDIFQQRGTIPQPNRKRRIPTLPTKLGKLRPFRLNPFGRRTLQPLHHSRNRFRSCDEKRNVHMIGHPANPHTNILLTIKHRSQISMHLAPNTIIQKRSPVLGAEHQMHKNIREGLGHDGEYIAHNLTPHISFNPITKRTTTYNNKISHPAQPCRLKTHATLGWDRGPGSPVNVFRSLGWGVSSNIHPAPNCGLKARATLAWGEAPGNCRPNPRGLKASAKCLRRHKSPFETAETESAAIFCNFRYRFIRNIDSFCTSTLPKQIRRRTS